jgi:hypothetical protein
MTTEPADSADLMPPKKPLSVEQQEILNLNNIHASTLI